MVVRAIAIVLVRLDCCCAKPGQPVDILWPTIYVPGRLCRCWRTVPPVHGPPTMRRSPAGAMDRDDGTVRRDDLVVLRHRKKRRPSANGRFLKERAWTRVERMTPEERLAEALRLHRLALALRRVGESRLASKQPTPSQ